MKQVGASMKDEDVKKGLERLKEKRSSRDDEHAQLSSQIMEQKVKRIAQIPSQASNVSPVTPMPSAVDGVVADMVTRESSKLAQGGTTPLPFDGANTIEQTLNDLYDATLSLKKLHLEQVSKKTEPPTREEVLSAIGQKCDTCSAACNHTPEACERDRCPLWNYRIGLGVLFWNADDGT